MAGSLGVPVSGLLAPGGGVVPAFGRVVAPRPSLSPGVVRGVDMLGVVAPAEGRRLAVSVPSVPRRIVRKPVRGAVSTPGASSGPAGGTPGGSPASGGGVAKNASSSTRARNTPTVGKSNASAKPAGAAVATPKALTIDDMVGAMLKGQQNQIDRGTAYYGQQNQALRDQLQKDTATLQANAGDPTPMTAHQDPTLGGSGNQQAQHVTDLQNAATTEGVADYIGSKADAQNQLLGTMNDAANFQKVEFARQRPAMEMQLRQQLGMQMMNQALAQGKLDYLQGSLGVKQAGVTLGDQHFNQQLASNNYNAAQARKLQAASLNQRGAIATSNRDLGLKRLDATSRANLNKWVTDNILKNATTVKTTDSSGKTTYAKQPNQLTSSQIITSLRGQYDPLAIGNVVARYGSDVQANGAYRLAQLLHQTGVSRQNAIAISQAKFPSNNPALFNGVKL